MEYVSKYVIEILGFKFKKLKPQFWIHNLLTFSDEQTSFYVGSLLYRHKFRRPVLLITSHPLSIFP